MILTIVDLYPKLFKANKQAKNNNNKNPGKKKRKKKNGNVEKRRGKKRVEGREGVRMEEKRGEGRGRGKGRTLTTNFQILIHTRSTYTHMFDSVWNYYSQVL